MSKNDPHPAIHAEAVDYGHWAEGAHIDAETFATASQLASVLKSPAERMASIRMVDKCLSLDDGTSLKSKAELLNLRRRLSHTHHAMLKAGR
jgi:hypothetical protein